MKRELTPAQLAALAKGRGSGAGGRPPIRDNQKRQTLSLSLSPETVTALKKARSKTDVSMSQFVEGILERWLERGAK